MAIQIELKHGLDGKQEMWLAKNIGPRLFYLHNAVGGQGWVARYDWSSGMVHRKWTLTFEDDRYASFFLLSFPQ